MTVFILESDWAILFASNELSLATNVVLSEFWSKNNAPQKLTVYRRKAVNKEFKELKLPYYLRRSSHGEGYYILIKK